MLAGGKSLDVAQQYNLKPVVLGRIDEKGNDAAGKKYATTLPAFDKVLAQSFKMKKGEASQLIETPTGEFLVASVKDVYPSEDQPFDKVRPAVLESWKQAQSAACSTSRSPKSTTA